MIYYIMMIKIFYDVNYFMCLLYMDVIIDSILKYNILPIVYLLYTKNIEVSVIFLLINMLFVN
jgi:hypothetical protein